LQVVKRGTIGLVCKACGNQSLVDLRHKLCTYIVKNPPQKDKKEKNKSGKERSHSSEEETSANGHTNGVKQPSAKQGSVSQVFFCFIVRGIFLMEYFSHFKPPC